MKTRSKTDAQHDSWTFIDRDGKEVIGRFATEKDIPGILAIRPNIFVGRDYLLNIIDDLMKNPRCKTFVVVREEKIVSNRYFPISFSLVSNVVLL